MPVLVVVSGLPGSGKSTLGRPLAAALGLPYLDKDDILEALFDSLGCSTHEERRTLSRTADAVLLRVVEDALGGAVLCSFWRPPGLATASGTPCDGLARIPGARLVEVRCTCPPELAAGRFLARRRHPGHLDADRSPADLRDQLATLEASGPLGIGPLVEVDTSGGPDAVDVTAVAARVREIATTRG